MDATSGATQVLDTERFPEDLVAAVTSVYWRFVPDDEVAGRGDDELAAAVRSHIDLAAQRVEGQLRIRLLPSAPGSSPLETEPEVTESAPGAKHRPPPPSVIEIITDDMPFLVDSVSSELARLGVGVRLFIHPQIVVRRNAIGVLQEVFPDVDPDETSDDQRVESWMHVEIDRQTEPSMVEKLHENLRRVLTDVREVVEDWPKMRTMALSLADELAQADLPVPSKDVQDSRLLLKWLADGHFTFLGYREYTLDNADEGMWLSAVLGTGLGILRNDTTTPRNMAQMSPDARERALEHRLLIITKANSRATVHRPAYMDYISFKTFDSAGNVVGERRFLGLFSATAYMESVRKLPVISRKVEEVLASSGLSLRSHSGKELLQILEAYPRDELFQMNTGELRQTVLTVLRLTGRRELRLFIRKDAYGRFVSCLVYLPRDRYNTRTRFRMQEILTKAVNGVGVDYSARVTEGLLARVRFVVRTDPKAAVPEVDVNALQQRLTDVTRLWEEEFAEKLSEELGSSQARELQLRYATAFGDGYAAEHSAEAAVADVARLEALESNDELAVHIERPRSHRPDRFRSDGSIGSKSGIGTTVDVNDRPASAIGAETIRFLAYRRGEPMSLSAILPILQSLGVSVIDERPYRVSPKDAPACWIYDFGLLLPPESDLVSDAANAEGGLVSSVRRAMENAFVACWRGASEIDGFNGLVLRAGLQWDQVAVLRAYARYLRQVGIVYGEQHLQRSLLTHPHIAALLVELFDARFNPARQGRDTEQPNDAPAVLKKIEAALDDVVSLDHDRIMRSFLTLINATLRTNHYQRGSDGVHKPYVSFKLDPTGIPNLPQPRPKYEIFVYSPRMEGVHLRFGGVARGGLRWSDRREDFRTEVLGLVKAQMVKNSVIVPAGAKGGFVLKKAPKAGDRQAMLDEGIACYKWFISALLDITDNRVDGEIVPPTDVVRLDGDDPYLVVAADKGTATFSDIANEVAESYGFWLDDAFASGGSVGYDHKAMGITARGAWESTKTQFRGLGIDTQTQDFTVVGVGDMSGDVFGNGMQLSKHIRLVAAFDHRHIFIDPSPVAETSFAERLRLFELPVSSWADYDTSLISEGGGVWSREVKAIPISPQVREALGLADGEDGPVTALSPPELIAAILSAPVDLVFNGGIGTYVKASTESHADVGDKSNDAVRVNGNQLRAKVVVEGGNLGLTQRGRIEFASSGGRIFTDAIDNAAGVNCSDHEVNIKILLRSAAEAGKLERPARDELLVEMTDEVADLVLYDNYLQDHSLALSSYLGSRLLNVHSRLMDSMERVGRLDRELEFLPSAAECAEREAKGKGLSAPELAVLMAYVKIGLSEDVLTSVLPDEAWCADILVDYFPTPLRERYRAEMDTHPLRREIIVTVLANEVVNRGGISFVYRALEETGADPADVIRAYQVISTVLGLPALWERIHVLDNQIPTKAQWKVLSRLRRVLDRGVRWLLQSRSGSIDVNAEIARLGPGVAELLPHATEFFVGEEAVTIRGYVDELIGWGVPAEIAESVVGALYGFGLFDVVELATQTQEPPRAVAEVYYTASARFGMDQLFERVTNLPRQDRWSVLARMAMRYDLYAVLAGTTREVLRATSAGEKPEDRVAAWARRNQVDIGRVQNTLSLFSDQTPADLAALSVLLRQLRSLASPGGA